MSDYKDVIKAAIEGGFPLDICGTAERDYSWGVNSDFCGSLEEFKEAMRLGELSPGEVCTYDELIYKWGLRLDLDGMCPEEALAAQIGDGGSSKILNVITFAMQDNGEGVYVLTLSASYEPDVEVAISFQMDGVQQNLTLPIGQKTLVTDLKGTDIHKPYASISLITITAIDETYTYTSKNTVKSGKFTLTIINQGVRTTQSVKCGDTVVLDTPSPKEGYTFVWRDKNGNVIQNNTFIMPDGATQVTGTYEVNQYALHYVVREQYFDNGELKTRIYNENDITVNYGEKIYPLLPSAQRTGYTNLQWAYNSTIITTATTMPAENITAESTYALSVFTLTFKVDNTVYETQNLRYTEAVTYPDDPSKVGYTFLQWDNIIETMPASNTIVNAVFSAIPYYIYYYINNVRVDDYTEMHTYGDAITIRQNEDVPGYTFSGWYPESLPSTMPAENIEVSATLIINDYVLTIVSSGTTLYRGTYHYNDPVSVSIEDPSETGYDFTGWLPAIPTVMPNNDVECVAQFAIKHMTVTYRYDNGDIYTAITYSYGETISPVASPSKEGYTFTGWDGEIPAVAGVDDVDVTAIFTINTYTITYVIDGVSSAVSYTYGASVTPHVAPSKTGYTFTGWDGQEPATMPAQNLTLTALFTINSHTITWYVDNVLKYTDTYNYGDIVTGRAEETREGYTFSGWDTQVPAVMDDQDYVVRGTFSINQYTMTFIVDGVVYTSLTQDYNTVITAPVPVKEGYTFNGWTTTVPARMPAYDTTINGTCTINQYVATYMNGDTLYTSITYNYGAQITYPELPEISGQTFVWERIYDTMPAMNITINGSYQDAKLAIRVFYGTVPDTGVTTFTSFNQLNYVDYVFGQASPMTFVVPASPDYERASTELPENEWQQWLAEHMYDYFVAIPYDPSITAVTFENAAGMDVTDLMSTLSGTVVYNDVDYVVYYRNCHSQQGTDGPQIVETIEIRRNSQPSVLHNAAYIIDGVFYSSMTYSVGAVIEYPDVPKQGYVLRWTKVYEVMPNFDIIIYGTYQEITNTTMIYYGPVIVGDVPTFNNFQSLQQLECTIGYEANITITVPLSPEYEEASKLPEEEFREWMAIHTYHYYMLIPVDPTLTYIFRNEGGTDISSTVHLVDNATVNIGGIDYKKYHKECCSQTDEPQNATIRILFNKI